MPLQSPMVPSTMAAQACVRYTPTYYAAFVIDPDGNNLEVVCHAAE